MNYHKGFIAPLLLILVALFLLGGGAFVYQQTKLTSQPVTQPEIATSTAQTVNSQKIGWKTYRSEKYGFILQYPQAWGPSLKVSSELVRFSDGTQGEALFFAYNSDTLFSISVFTKSQWALRLKDDYPNPEYLKENSSYVFASTATQNGVYRAPDSILKDVDAVLATFKLQ